MLSKSSRRTSLVAALMLIVLIVAGAAAPASPQFLPFPAAKGRILEGNWQSCQGNDGRYAERVYDHIVNGVGQFEVHMGPRREFAIFKGVQDDHRPHDGPDNLLKPFNVPLVSNRAKHRWEIPSLGVAFSVTLGGGSTTDCESWYVVLEQTGKPAEVSKP